MTTEYLLDKEVEMVLGALTEGNRLVMCVCLHTGLRVSDVLNLKKEQIKPRFWITESKTGKRRLVGLPEPLRDEIIRHAGRSEWAFPGAKPGTHRTRQAVWKDVKRAAKLYRIPQNVAPHSFRKVYAVQLLEKYGDIEKVQKALNHGSLETTLIYCCAAQRLQAKTLKQMRKRGKGKVLR